MDKLLGQKFKLAVVDEASKFRVDMHRLIFDVMKPAIADYNGTIVLIGTATNYINSYFARASRGIEPGWSVHKWSALDNPHMKRQFQLEMDQHRVRNPLVDKEAWFIQNYLGEWVVDTKALIYKYSHANLIDELPDNKDYTYVLGVKISYSGHTAFAVAAYSTRSRDAYILEAYKLNTVDIYRIVEEALKLDSRYKFASIICADVSKRLTQEIRSRFPLSVEDHSEKDKEALMRLFASELKQKNIKVFRKNTDIVLEWDSIIRDETYKRGLREDPRCPNAVSTAALYAWQKCFNYGYMPKVTSEDPVDDYWDKLAEDVREGRNRSEEDQFIDDYFY